MKYPYIISRILDYYPGLVDYRIVRRLKLSTFVNLRKRYLYFAVNKAGCTQMKWLLRGVEGARGPLELFPDATMPETRRDMFIHARGNVPLPSLADLDNNAQKEVLESTDFLRMTIVRDPYSRLMSAWRSKVLLCEPPGRTVYLKVKGRLPGIDEDLVVSFEEFVHYVGSEVDMDSCDSHWARQVDCTYFPAINFSFVGRIERLDESLTRLQLHLGLSEPLIAGGKNESIRIDTTSYNNDTADRVYSLYRKDFDVFGYDRSSWLRIAAEKHCQPSANNAIPQARLRDEIIERNLVILGLYEERQQIKSQLRLIAENVKTGFRERRKVLSARLRSLLGDSKPQLRN